MSGIKTLIGDKMKLDEALNKLKCAGYIVESVNKEEVFNFFYDLKSELEALDYKVSSVSPDYSRKSAAWKNTFLIKKFGVTISFCMYFRSKQNDPYIITLYQLKDDFCNYKRKDFDYEGNCKNIVKRVEEIFNTDEEILELKKKNNDTDQNKPKYTNLQTYKSDIYDALTARGLNSEFAMDYVNGLDKDFMLDNQDIKKLADEAAREWG